MRVVRKALTFDDVLLVPAHSIVVPRDVSLKTRLTAAIALNIPLAVGGDGHGDRSPPRDRDRAGRRPRRRPQEHDAGEAGGRSREGQALRKRRRQGSDHDPADDVGARGARADARSTGSPGCRSSKASASSASSPTATCGSRRTSTSRSSNIMTQGDRLVTVPEGTDLEHAKALMHRHRLERVLVVNDDDGAARPHHRQGHPQVDRAPERVQGRARAAARRRRGRHGAATPTSASRRWSRPASTCIVVDTAHGHSQGVLDRVAVGQEALSAGAGRSAATSRPPPARRRSSTTAPTA